ncbi:MAG TPA: sugar phosphate nucleotidyltransferase [Fimbriimonadales bacterium]|nr:sugar phosphate nucleotidyltransferase [Fimbriimonadales bacterium]
MKGVILAAGKGTRLYPVTHYIPKPLLPLANRPTLYYAFDRLKEIEATELCIVVGENAKAIEDALGDGSSLGLSLTYAIQSEPKGLAHALSFAKSFCGDEDFILYLGDAVYSESFVELYHRFRESRCANLNMVMEVNDPERFGVANVEGERIVKLVEKPKKPESNLAMAGVYFFTPRIWDVLPDLKPSARGEYEITDAIQLLIERGELVLAGRYRGKWFDTGTLDSYLACSAFLLNNGVLVGGNSEVIGQVGDAVCIGENVRLECVSITDSVILPQSKVRVNGSIEHCIIGGEIEEEASLKGRILYGVKN